MAQELEAKAETGRMWVKIRSGSALWWEKQGKKEQWTNNGILEVFINFITIRERKII